MGSADPSGTDASSTLSRPTLRPTLRTTLRPTLRPTLGPTLRPTDPLRDEWPSLAGRRVFLASTGSLS
ncbi:MAG: hypothetical protein AAGC92_07580 [Pseudomonadota bacterium]